MPDLRSIEPLGRSSSSSKPPKLFPLGDFAQRLLPMERVRELYIRALQSFDGSILENLLVEMEIEYKVSNSDLARIPITGAALVVANHPFGILDGMILGTLLQSVRPDVKIMTNSLLAGIPELHEHCFFVDPFGTKQAIQANRKALKQAIVWLKQGGMLAMFPAGEVSHLDWKRLEVSDPEWSPTVARMARLTGSPVLPVYFRGQNGATFQTLGLIHPRLRTTWLLNEFLQQKGKKVEVRVGSFISKNSLAAMSGDMETARYLRWRTYLLARRGELQRELPSVLRSVLQARAEEPVAPSIPNADQLREIEALAHEKRLHESRDFDVYLADYGEIPTVMQELGRLRELTFRAAGEGTGKPRDLDRFDPHYKHVLLWNRARQEIAGAYRIGIANEILPRFGASGLYTNTLFRYNTDLFDALGPALELGRSFIRIEYQKQYTPLLVLWKGIGSYLASHPETPVLFGAVSISRCYHRVSRDLIFRFFQTRESEHEFSKLIKPRNPFRPAMILPKDQVEACNMFHSLEQLADPISDVESDGKGIPILLRHYAKLGGRLLSFNVDRNFSNVLDGLVVVDLRRSDPVVLGRYMSKDGLNNFRRYHGLSTDA